MRPLCLIMTAFGPYAQRQELDFRELKERSFFLIHGPTGAGKTTILDGICFALFGDASGTQRDGKSMRSDHADSAVITEVTFDFMIGEACYQVKRIPEQERPKKRGDGTTTMLAQAELWSRPRAGQPVLLAAKWLDVTRQVEGLLGFKSSQFRQVVLLPQGEFRRLLTANSNERQEIMQALFKTDLYRSIEEKLKENALVLKKSSEEERKQRRWILQEAGVDGKDELLDRLRQNDLAAESLIRELRVISAGLKTAQEAVNQGLAVQEKIREKEKAGQLLAALVKQKPVIEEERAGLLRAMTAAQLFDAEKNVYNCAQDVLSLEKGCKKYKDELDLAMQQLQKAEQLFAIEAAKESERERMTGEIIQLQQLEEKISQLEQAVEALTISRQELNQAARKKETLELAYTLLQEKIEHSTLEEQKYIRLSLETGSRESEWQQAQGALAKSRLLAEYRSRFAALELQVSAAAEKIRKLETDFLAAKSSFIELQNTWIQGQAALMASNLAAGTACPVCGSTGHPSLAVSVEKVPNEQQLKGAQMQLEVLEQEREACRKEHDILQIEWHTWRKRIDDLLAELKEEAALSLAEMEKRVHLLGQQRKQALAVQKQARDLAEELIQLKKQQEETRQKLLAVQEAWRQAGQSFTTAETIVRERRLAIPEDLQEKGKLSAVLQSIQNTCQRYKAAWETAQDNLQQGKQLLMQKQTLWETTKKRLDAARVKYEEEEQYFIKRLTAAGFMGRQDYEKAKRSPDIVESTTKKITEFDAEFSKASLLHEQAVQAAADLDLPDMQHLQQAVVEKQKQYNDLLSVQANLEALLKRQKAWLEKITQADNKLAAFEAEYAVAGRLAEVANGGNEYKLTLQRFVLGTLLENVIIAANERLRMMSRSRYLLQRTLDRARKNAAGGLDLEVFDNYTGIARGVGTLSGGETFLASLSLALGLADVVQSYAGGIHLDTVLVDEGFGTLDPETLDFAIKALIDLQQGGRLVGIISHVPELKERIDARLEVMATERGSKACFKIG